MNEGAELELLEIRVKTFMNEVQNLVPALDNADIGDLCVRRATSALEHETLSPSWMDELIPALVAHERERRDNLRGMDWYGPAEQLSLQVAFFTSWLFDEVDAFMAELESHATHGSRCRCPVLRRLLHEHIDPCFEDSKHLAEAIERYRDNHPRQQ